jgi:hypothetical protein
VAERAERTTWRREGEERDGEKVRIIFSPLLPLLLPSVDLASCRRFCIMDVIYSTDYNSG